MNWSVEESEREERNWTFTGHNNPVLKGRACLFDVVERQVKFIRRILTLFDYIYLRYNFVSPFEENASTFKEWATWSEPGILIFNKSVETRRTIYSSKFVKRHLQIFWIKITLLQSKFSIHFLVHFFCALQKYSIIEGVRRARSNYSWVNTLSSANSPKSINKRNEEYNE